LFKLINTLHAAGKSKCVKLSRVLWDHFSSQH